MSLMWAGTVGHVAHGKSTLVKAISGVQTVRFKNELERNITIKLGYANAKIYKCSDPKCPRLVAFLLILYSIPKHICRECDGIQLNCTDVYNVVSTMNCLIKLMTCVTGRTYSLQEGCRS